MKNRFKQSQLRNIALSFFVLCTPLPSIAEDGTIPVRNTSETGQGNDVVGCTASITYARDPETEEWQAFLEPDDVPADQGQTWEQTQLKPGGFGDTIIYAKAPTTEIWQTYPTLCDVPDGWEKTLEEPDNFSSYNSESGNSSIVCAQVITYAQNPNTQSWHVFATPCDVPAEWVSSQTEQVCAEVIIYGQSPTTERWYAFSTHCDLPQSWKSSLTKPDDNANGVFCGDDIMYAKSPKTDRWYFFPQSCDAPENWEQSTLPPSEGFTKQQDLTDACTKVLTYAKNPDTGNWYAFPTACDVPAVWVNSAPLPNELLEESCSSSHSIYSASKGTLHIPFVYVDDSEEAAFKEVVLEVVQPIFDPLLFFLKK